VKLKCLPEDFRVEELTRVQPGKGTHAFYRLTKRSIGTPEALSAIVRRFRIHRKQLNYGGLKDRHAVTVQYLTIRNGPRRGFTQKSFELEYLGQTDGPYGPQHFDGNRFRLILRAMDDDAIAQALAAVDRIPTHGIPNYFDDQRFGSLGISGEWIARAWCLGDYERALWLALADPHKHDSAQEKKQKSILRDNWNSWPSCKAMLDRSHRRSIVTYLSDKVEAGKPADFRGAFARIKVDLRGLYLSAWQSALWNRIVSRLLVTTIPEPDDCTVALRSGPAIFPVLSANMATPLETLDVPLPSARIKRPEGPVGDAFDAVLAEEGIELRQVRVKYPRDSFFSRLNRAAILRPSELSATTGPDELHPRSQALTLEFSLPRGSYATMLVKSLTCGRQNH